MRLLSCQFTALSVGGDIEDPLLLPIAEIKKKDLKIKRDHILHQSPELVQEMPLNKKIKA